MPRKRKLTNLADRCRFCLARDPCMRDLFVDWLKPKFQDLEKCSSAEVLDKPNYPKSICYVCLYKLEMWNEFKLQFLKTNKTLMTHFKCVESSQENDVAKSLNPQETTDLNSDNNQKRPKIDIQEPEKIKPNETLNETNTETAELIQTPINEESVENAASDTLRGSNLEDNGTASITKTQPSDSSITNSKKIGSRSRKIERVASTKRWVERKNALIAATGEVPSESDSDNGAQLSPVQKARAKSNNEKELENQRRKLEKALKNLQTNLTEKYRVNQEDIVDEERKTRSRRSHTDDQKGKETKLGSSNLADNEKKLETLKVDIKETDKLKDVKETSKSLIKEPEQSVKNNTETTELSPVINEIQNHTQIPESTEENNEILEKVTEKANVDNEAMEIDPVVEESNNLSTPQLVSSEVSLGNATYIVTTTLDVPNASSSKSDISLKTNGINIDATSEDGQKVNILNAVQLKHVKNTDESTNKITSNSNKSESDAQKCLKIEIEGMEVEALQRVQKELAHFVQEEIGKRVINEAPTKHKTDKQSIKLKDTYETLDHQLKSIIEKVLRTNFEADKNSEKSWSINNKKISLEFLKAAKKSPVFQPNVEISQLNISEVGKVYQINNLHILENAKRRVGPRSRTLGKRKHVLPKKYDGFSLSLKPEDEEIAAATKLIVSKPSTPVPIESPKIVENALKNTKINTLQFSVDHDVEDSTLPVNDVSSNVIQVVKEKVSTESSQSAIEDQSTTSSVVVTKLVKNIPLETKTLTEYTHKEKFIGITTDIVEVPAKSLSLKPGESVKPRSFVLQKEVNERTKQVPASVAALPVIKSKPVPVIYPKPKDLPRPAIAVVNSNKPLPSIANRPMNLNSSASKAKLPLPSLINKNSTNNITSINNVQKPGKRQRHICGICGIELFSKEDAEIHVKNHTGESIPVAKSSFNTTIAPTPLLQSTKPKPKLMRCKRCQAIVEARNVKTHVCDSVKYKCRLCDCSFGAEHLLVAHLETHTQIKEKPNTMKPPATTVKKITGKDPQRIIVTKEGYRKIPEHNQEDLEEALSEKEPQGYSCFVCDKVFVDEEQMKDHLQMHCEEVSDESNEKGFQCAFCGEKFQTEESLETHVGDHLLEDGDEKINMIISMGTRRDRQKKTVFRCEQCLETFSSSLLLAMHLPMHEEEEAATMIAEYEKQQQEDAETEHHVCVICDEIFDTPEELSEHQDVHNGNAHVCILCEKPFSSIRDLQEHVSTHL